MEKGRIARCVFVYVYTQTENGLDHGERVYSAADARCLHGRRVSAAAAVYTGSRPTTFATADLVDADVDAIAAARMHPPAPRSSQHVARR